jgi:hypothetical protein
MIGLLVCLLLQSAQKAPMSVGAELLARNLPVPKDAADLEQPITSYSVLDDNRGFVIAYYGQEPDGMLHELRVRSFDRRTRIWRSRTFAEPIGSILKLERNAGIIYVKGHSSPSATPTLVLSEDLALRHELDGWSMLMLDRGRMIFSRSMRHFSPTHAEVLALYDPAANREESLYPPASVQNDRGAEKTPDGDLWIDRSFSDVKKGHAPGTIEFVAVEQRIRLDSRNTPKPAGPERRLRIVCTVNAGPPICESRSPIPVPRSLIPDP